MLRLRTFGTLDLTRPGGGSVDEVLRRPKRAALLVHLACARPLGFHPRARLLPLFWPELDERRARGALSSTLYGLRKTLGADLLVSRGDDVGLDPARLWCDAPALEERLATGDAEGALALYAGDFLSGFQLTGAPDFEGWLALRRRHLHRRAREACDRLVAAAAGEREVLEWSRRAVALDPVDEGASARLMRLLSDGGKRSAALRELERLTVALRETFETSPSEATLALAGSIRRGDRRAKPVRRADAPPSAETRPEPPDQAGESSSPRTPPRRSLSIPAVTGLAAIAAVAVALATAGEPAASPPPGPRVAILPFEFAGDERRAYLGPAVSRVLAAGMETPGVFEPVDPNALAARASSGVGPDDPIDAARTVAGHFGADRFVLGDVVATGEELALSASLYDAGGRRLGVARAVAPEESRLLSAVDDLARQLLVSPNGADAPLLRAAAVTTASLPALRAFVAAEAAYREGRFEAAMTLADEAIAEDTLFALAWYRKALMADWSGQYDEGWVATRRTWELRDRLPEVERLLAEASYQQRADRTDSAEAILRRVIHRQPHNVDAWGALAELEFHRVDGSVLPSEAKAAFRRTLELDPRFPGGRLHLARIAAAERDLDGLSEIVDQALSKGAAGEEAVELRALLAFATTEPETVEASLAELAQLGDEPLVRIVQRVIGFTGEFHATRPAVALLRGPLRARELGAHAAVLDAYLDAASGRNPLARFDGSAAAQYPRLHLLGRGMVAAASWVPAPEEELRSIQAELRTALVEGPEPRPTGVLQIESLTAPHMPAFLYGLVSARLGDAPAVEEAAGVLASSFERMGPKAARIVRAALAHRRGDARAGLRALGTGPTPVGLDGAGVEVFLRAEFLRESGRLDEALRMYASFNHLADFSAFYRGPSHLRRAQIHEGRGESEQAARQYALARRTWRGSLLEDATRLAGRDPVAGVAGGASPPP